MYRRIVNLLASRSPIVSGFSSLLSRRLIHGDAGDVFSVRRALTARMRSRSFAARRCCRRFGVRPLGPAPILRVLPRFRIRFSFSGPRALARALMPSSPHTSVMNSRSRRPIKKTTDGQIVRRSIEDYRKGRLSASGRAASMPRPRRRERDARAYFIIRLPSR